MTNLFEQATKYKMTILQIAFALSADIHVYICVRETKQRNEKVSREKKPRHGDVTKKKVRRHTKNDSATGKGEGGEKSEEKQARNSKEK